MSIKTHLPIPKQSFKKFVLMPLKGMSKIESRATESNEDKRNEFKLQP